MASPVITNITVTPASPVIGEPFSIRVEAMDPDTRSERYTITVTDQGGTAVTSEIQVPFHDPVFIECAPQGNAPPVVRNQNDPSLFEGVAA